MSKEDASVPAVSPAEQELLTGLTREELKMCSRFRYIAAALAIPVAALFLFIAFKTVTIVGYTAWRFLRGE